MQFVAALLGVVATAWLFRRSPELGCLALLVGDLLLHAVVIVGTGTDLNFPTLVVPVLVVLWLRGLAGRNALHGVAWSPPVPALAGFLAVGFLSLVLANVPWVRFAFALWSQEWFPLARPAPLRAQVGQLGILAICVATFVMVADAVRSLRWLGIYTAAFLLVAAVAIAGWTVPELRSLLRGLLAPGIGDGSQFWIWVVALASTQAAFNDDLPAGVRVALGALVGAALYATAGENRGWLSGWLPACFAVAAGVCVGMPRVALVLAIAAAVGLAGVGPQLLASVATAENQYSLATRLEAWRSLGTMILANPLVGLGPANYYHYGVHFPLRGYQVPFSSHNTYIDVVAQTGIVGLACLAWFAWWIARRAWALRTTAPTGFARAYVVGALAGLAGMLAAGMLGDWVLPFAYNTGRAGLRASLLGWFFLAGLLVVRRAAPKGSSSADGLDPTLAR
jgi:O-antigen ligase